MKKILLALALMFFLLIAIYPDKIFLKCIEWKLQSYTTKAFGTKLEIGQLTWRDGRLTVQNGKLRGLTFSRAILEPKFDWEKREIGGDLIFEDLQIVRRKTQVLPNPASPSLPFFKLNLNTTIRQGELLLYDYSGIGPFFQHLMFDLDHHITGKQVFGKVRLINFSQREQTEKNPNIEKITTFFWRDSDDVVRLATEFKSHSFPKIYGLVSYFFQTPELSWNLHRGTIDGNLELALANGRLRKVKGELTLANVQAQNPILEVLGEIDCVECNLNIDFSSASGFNGEFLLQGGRLALQENSQLWGGIWDLSNLHSKICVKEGNVEQSTLRGNLMGMEGELVFDWNSTDDLLMHLGFHGLSKEMWSLFPNWLQEGFQEAFPEDYFALDATMKRTGKGLELEGSLAITDENDEIYQLSFGCCFGETKEAVVSELVSETLSNSFFEHVKDQFCLSNKRLGWFRGNRFPLEKFLSPFLLRDVSMGAFGNMDFEGTFDEHYLIVCYEGENFRLEGPHFCLEADRIEEESEDDMRAVHYFDLRSWDHVGFLPLKTARYYQKNRDLYFSQIDALVHFNNKKIHIKDVKASYDKDLYPNKLKNQNLDCAKAPRLTDRKQPHVSNIGSFTIGQSRELSRQPKSDSSACLGIKFHGGVEIAIEALDDISLSIKADSLSGSLSSTQSLISHFTDSWVWRAPLEGEVNCDSDALFFNYRFSPRAELLEGRMQTEMTLQASSSLCSVDQYHAHLNYDVLEKKLSIQEGKGAFSFREKGYLFTTPEIALTPGLKLDFTLNSDLCEMKGTIQEGGDWLVEGDPFYFKASQNDRTLTISKCYWKEWQVDGAIDFLEKKWVIDRLGCWANGAGLTISGVYDFESRSIKGDIEEMSLPFEKIPSPWKPKGEVFGFGTFLWSFREDVQSEIEATISFHDFEFGGLPVGDRENLRCFYSPKYGLSLEGLEFEGYKLGRFHYNFAQQKVLFEGVDFSLSPDNLPWVLDKIEQYFPGKIDPEWIIGLKQNEPLEGRLSLEIYPENLWIYLSMKEGSYTISGRTFDLKDFSLIYDPLELNVWTQCFFRDRYYWLHFLADSMSLSHGKIGVSEGGDPQDTLVATWERQKDKGWCIRHIEGSLRSINAALHGPQKMDFSESISLKGRVDFDPTDLYSLFPNKLQELITRFSLSGGYALEGEFSFLKDHPSQFSFLGTFLGNDFNIAGIKLGAFSSDIDYQPGKLDFTHLSVKDWAGRLAAEKGSLSRVDDRWTLKVDQLELDDLRLSRLKAPWVKKSPGEKNFFRSLFIRHFSLDNLQGTFGDHGSFVGSGGLAFTNLPKRTLFTNLLLLPTEITARIGLDLTALVPAMGTILYDIHDGRIFFKEFKEMYSDGKRSRFYLAEGSTAYIDFDGNLNLKVKMKQYNLLMKLAEFFTIAVKGTVFNPKYTFSNQVDDDLTM